jgi:hypothetical protein
MPNSLTEQTFDDQGSRTFGARPIAAQSIQIDDGLDAIAWGRRSASIPGGGSVGVLGPKLVTAPKVSRTEHLVSPRVARYRCTACGNLTRFDVVSTRQTRAFHHYSMGGELSIEDEHVLRESVDEVCCRWCGSGDGVEVLTEDASA